MRTARALLLTAGLALLGSAAARAQQFTPAETFVPPSNPGGINFQGRLEERGALVNGARPMVFRLYDAATAGNKLWDSGIQTVSVEDGIFGLVLNIPTQALLGGTSKFLELEVDNLILLPREQLRSVPYAKIAERVEGSIDISTGGLRITTSTVPGDAVFVSSITGFVGIGSTAPQAKLTVSSSVPGAVAGSPDLLNPSAADGTGLRVTFNFDPAGAAAAYAAAESVRETAGGDARLAFYTRAGASFAERVRVTPAGDVGVSTPTPAARLHVATGSPAGLSAQHATQPRLTFRRAAADVWVFEHDGTLGSAGTVSATDLVFDVGGSSKVRVASGGDTAIGLAAAARKLDAGGALRASTVESSAAGAVGAPALILGADPDTGLFAPGADIVAASVGGAERLRARNTGAAFAADATLGSASGGSPSAAPDLFLAGNLSVDGQIVGSISKSTDSVGVSTTTILGQNFKVGAGTFTVLEAGRVGIGTTAPGFALELQARSQPAAAVDHAAAGRLSLRAGSSERMQFAAFVSSAVVLTPAGGTDLLLGGLLRLDSGGFVGINGSNPPGSQLEVGGDASVTGLPRLGTPLAVAEGGTAGRSQSTAQAGLDAPSRAGAGASGTWGIAVTGNAGGATQISPAANDRCGPGEFPKGISSTGAAQGCATISSAFTLGESTDQARMYDDDNILGSNWVVGASGLFDIQFDTNSVTDSTFYLDSSADRIGLGNLPIGPQHKLDVVGNLNASAKLREGGNDLLPAGAVIFSSNTAGCPAGWTEFILARGRMIVGVPSGGTVGGTVNGPVGGPLGNQGELPAHTHSLNSHTHNLNPDGAGHSHGPGAHTHGSIDPDGAGHTHGPGAHTHSADPDNGIPHGHTWSHTHDVNYPSTLSSNEGAGCVNLPANTGNEPCGGTDVPRPVAPHDHTADPGNAATTANAGAAGTTNLTNVTSATPSANNTASTNLAAVISGTPSANNTASQDIAAQASGGPSVANTTAGSGTMPYIQLRLCQKT